ncbi:prepilin peptidase, partial [bacterium]|nr:prepilin peptidase [bacterium]
MLIFILVFIFCTGLLFGSFINVLIWRLPRDESIIRPRSH